jgi:hypothetical protein
VSAASSDARQAPLTGPSVPTHERQLDSEGVGREYVSGSRTLDLRVPRESVRESAEAIIWITMDRHRD